MPDIIIVGAGFMGKTHAKAYAGIPKANVVAVVDVDPDRALCFGHGKPYTLLEKALRDTDAEIVDICLPTPYHAVAIEQAVQAKANIICEKPVTMEMAEAEKLRELIERAEIKFMAAQVVRFWPEYTKAVELIARGELGRIQSVDVQRLAARPGWGEWFKDPAKSGGALFDLHIHDIDYLIATFGEPVKISAVGVKGEFGAWDSVVSSLSYRGFYATARCSYLMPPAYGFRHGYTIVGTEGTLRYEMAVSGNVESRHDSKDLMLYKGGECLCIAADPGDAYQRELAYFVDCVVNHKQVKTASMSDVIKTLRILHDIRTCLETA